MSLASPRPWRQRAACRGAEPDAWYASERTPEGAEALARARAVCRGCPVAVECLGDALAMPYPMRGYGMFGGRAASERAGLVIAPSRRPLPARAPLRGDPVGANGAPSSWVANMDGRSATGTHTGDGWT